MLTICTLEFFEFTGASKIGNTFRCCVVCFRKFIPLLKLDSLKSQKAKQAKPYYLWFLSNLICWKPFFFQRVVVVVFATCKHPRRFSGLTSSPPKFDPSTSLGVAIIQRPPSGRYSRASVHPEKLMAGNLKMDQGRKRKYLLETHHFQVPAVSFRGVTAVLTLMVLFLDTFIVFNKIIRLMEIGMHTNKMQKHTIDV